MTNRCDLCKNKEICKYRKEYEARFEELTELDESNIRENPTFSIDLDCKYYEKEKQLSMQEMDEMLSRSFLNNIATTRIDPSIKYELKGALNHTKPAWCDRPYPCAECDRAGYCVDRYNNGECK